MTKRFVYAYLPFWDIQHTQRKLWPRRSALEYQQPGFPPILLLKSSDHQEMVLRCCPQCLKHHIHPGMSLAQARAILPASPTPQILSFDAQTSRRSLQNLSRWLRRFTPTVAVDAQTSTQHLEPTPDGVFLDISGAAHLFGGEMFLLRQIVHLLAQKGLRIKLAAAPTMGAAWALARFAPQSLVSAQPADLVDLLKPLPPAALRIATDRQEFLAGIGVKTIGDLLHIPAPYLALHAGAEVLHRRDQALGTRAELLVPEHSSPPLTLRWQAEGAMTDLQAILAATKSLVDQFALTLATHGQSVTAFKLEISGPDLAAYAILIMVTRPCLLADHLWMVLKPKVEELRLTAGVEIISMTAVDSVLTPQDQWEAWPTSAVGMATRENQALLGRTLDILRTRLPQYAIHSIAPMESHVPEQTWAWPALLPTIRENSAAPADSRMGESLAAHRPPVLLAPPEPALADTAAPHQAPKKIQWRAMIYHCAHSRGPERLDTEWWRCAPPETRDYFMIQTDDGQWLWIFHVPSDDRWYVHGLWN